MTWPELVLGTAPEGAGSPWLEETPAEPDPGVLDETPAAEADDPETEA